MAISSLLGLFFASAETSQIPSETVALGMPITKMIADLTIVMSSLPNYNAASVVEDPTRKWKRKRKCLSQSQC